MRKKSLDFTIEKKNLKVKHFIEHVPFNQCLTFDETYPISKTYLCDTDPFIFEPKIREVRGRKKGTIEDIGKIKFFQFLYFFIFLF